MSPRAKIADICRRYEIEDLYAFGSRAKEISGAVHDAVAPVSASGSDVDIRALPSERGHWLPEKRVQLSMELEDLFQIGRIDFVLLPEADPFLALDIIRGELL